MSIELVQSGAGQPPLALAAIAEGLIFCTVVPQESDGQILKTDIRTQTQRVFANLEKTLIDNGSSLTGVLHVTVYLTDISHRDAMTEVWRTIFEPVFPARATIGINELAHPDMLIEISVIASKTQ